MNLIIQQYLASLRERGELDAILPDLLSQLGLSVFSRPARGTRQAGVDVAAVGCINDGPERIYLFSIKAGNLTRGDWDGPSAQSLRPSLNEIVDSYIPTRLPPEHQGKDIVICIVLGGDVQEQVRIELTGYERRTTRQGLSFEEWNGSRLAELIEANFLHEDLLPPAARTHLRKSLALIDEPDSSHRHFSELIRSLSVVNGDRQDAQLTAIRQMAICLWILFAWARDAGNVESAYLSGEITLLHSWDLMKAHVGQTDPKAEALSSTFYSIFNAYQEICTEFLSRNVLPNTSKLHALSHAVHPACSLDVNLKLFDLLGRLALSGLWAFWGALAEDEPTEQVRLMNVARMHSQSIKLLISNNPALFLPIKDDQAIDLSIAALLLSVHSENTRDLQVWLSELFSRAQFAYRVHWEYPCTLRSYRELLSHPMSADDTYRKSVTQGSILFPMIALWSAIHGDEALYSELARWKAERLEHCNFQMWFPDELSETHFYLNDGIHGAIFSNVPVTHTPAEFLKRVYSECANSSQFLELSAVKASWWPLVVVACRRYRIPLPVHLIEAVQEGSRLIESECRV